MMGEILYYIFIFPLQAVLEFVLESQFLLTNSYGLSIVILSIIINLFLLKIFVITDKRAEFESKRKKEFDLRINAWKKVYKKAKLFAFTQTLYRQNHYHPIYALSALGGLALQIPFFYAMYFVIKDAEVLKGVSFLWISDLSLPDSVFVGAYELHLLPILMTIISLINVFVSTKDKGARVQGTLISLFFLVLLYEMPSALVLYWSTNMVFSLLKTIILKTIKPKISTQILNEQATNFKICENKTNEPKTLKAKINAFFIYQKALKVIVVSLTSILVLCLCLAIYLTSYVKEDIKTAPMTFDGYTMIPIHKAKIDFSNFNSILNSDEIAEIEIISVAWQKPEYNGVINILGTAKQQRVNISFTGPSKPDLYVGDLLGQVSYKINFYPLLNNIFIYYFGILGVIFNLYLVLCLFKKYCDFDDKSALMYHKMSVYAVLCIGILICIFSPYQLYNSDVTQFDASQTYITLTALFGAFLLLSFILIYLINFIPKKFINAVAALLSLVLIIGLIYSFILTGDYGVMDHFTLQKTPFYDESMQLNRILEFSAVLALSIAIIAIFFTKLLRVWQIAFITLFIVSGVNAAQIIIKRFDKSQNTQKSTSKIPYENELFSYSKNGKNIVVLVLDAFSSSHMPSILEQYPHFKENLDGFTFFANTSGTTISTIHTVATLIGGEYYAAYNMNKRKDHLAKSIDNAFISTTSTFSNNGFDVALIAEVGTDISNIIKANDKIFAVNSSGKLFAVETTGDFMDYYTHSEGLAQIISKAKKNVPRGVVISKMFSFGLFKFLPEVFRGKIYNDGFWLSGVGARLASDALSSIENSSTAYAATHILNTKASKPTFKYFHSMMTHMPYGMYFNNNSCEFFNTKTAWDDYPHKATMHYPNKNTEQDYYQHYDTEVCALKYLAEYIQLLKNHGIYDNTQIFVVSDHGGTDGINISIDSRPDALFLFKDFGKNGELKTDDRLMANYDIVSIFCENLKNGCPNVPKNILKNYPKNREIIHVVPTDWRIEMHKANQWMIERAYKVKGNIYDEKSWTDLSDKKYGIVNTK